MVPDGTTGANGRDTPTPANGRGIYQGWHVVLGGFLGAFVVFGLSYAFGVFLEPMQREFGLSRSGISLAFSLQTVVVYVGAAILGVGADRYGVGRLLLVGAILLGLGGVWTAGARSYPEVLIAYGVLTAIGLGAIYVVSYATVPRWFERRRGLATGIATAGLGVGMVVLPPAAGVMVEVTGWRTALLALVITGTLVVILAVPLFADDPVSAGADIGREFVDGVPQTGAKDWATYRREVGAVAMSRRFMQVFLGWVFVYATMYAVFVHLIPYAADAGPGSRAGALALAVIGGTTAVARVTVGGLSDRIGRFRSFVACSAGMAGITLVLPLIETTAWLLVFAVVFGTFYGGNGALLSPLIVDLFGAANPNAIFGLVSLSFAVSGLLAPWAAGFVYDVTGGYGPAFFGAGAIGLVGAGLVALAGVTEEGT